MVARTTHTRSAVQIDSTGNDHQTHYAGSPRRYSLYVGVYNPGEKKYCIHMLYCLNDHNYFILQLLQVSLLCYGAQKDLAH